MNAMQLHITERPRSSTRSERASTRRGDLLRRRRAGSPASAAAPAGFAPTGSIDASRPGGRAGAHRPLRAAARAGLRVQGDARVGDARRGRRRRDQPRLPARHRSAARRAGAGRDAQAPRAQPEPGARLSGRRAHREARGRAAHRDGGARRRRLRRLLAGERAARRHAGAVARAAVRGDLRLRGLAARRRIR